MSVRLWLQLVPRGLLFLASQKAALWLSCLLPPIPTERGAWCFMVRGANVRDGSFRLYPTISTSASTRIGELAQALPFSRQVSRQIRAFRELWARYERAGASPSAIKALIRLNSELDVSPILGSVKTSCLLLHRIGDRACSVEISRNLAKHLPNARYIELPGEDHAPIGDTKHFFDEIEEFLTGSRPIELTDRVLATVLFTDIVNSTAKATEFGDRRWRELLDAHDRAAAQVIDQHRGKLVKSTGDGILATFDGPGRGVRCALALGEVARQIGVPLRAGLHTGEVEVRGNDIGGIAVHVAARVMGSQA